MNQLNIEIHGAGFENKGAELMLRTTVAELEKRIPGFIPAVDPFYGTFKQRSSLGLHQIIPARLHVGTPGYEKRLKNQNRFAFFGREKIFQLLTGYPSSRYGVVTLSKVNALVDIAGFAYTDEWGSKPTQDAALLTGHYKNANKPVILMPQALGPFHKEETRIAFRKVINNSSLIFARDEQSFSNAMELVPGSKVIHLAPDITLFYPEITNDITTPENARYACIIPNIRMLDQGKEKWGDKYKHYLISAANKLLENNIDVFLVVHDTSGADRTLVQELNTELASSKVKVIEESDPLALKNIVAGSLMVIGSRFHSLVAAFSKLVPAVALGWSHKYDMLFRDFKMEKFVISPEMSDEHFLNLINQLIDPDLNLSYREKIKKELHLLYSVNQSMWNMVTECLVKKGLK